MTAPHDATPVAAQHLLTFWFGAQTGGPARWFTPDAQFDALCRHNFEALVEPALGGALNDWRETPAHRLALIILLDQIPRNIYRNTPQAFYGDPMALELCLDGLQIGMDQHLGLFERTFFYLPLEHAENLGMQERAVDCFEGMLSMAVDGDALNAQNFLDYARRHHDVIARFGRFPHRNAILGRESTGPELEFLGRPGSAF